MSLHKLFKADKDLEKQGIILQYGMNSKDQPIEIRIARAGGGNTQYSKLLDIKIKPYRRVLQQDAMDTKLQDKLLREVYADCIILGWTNVEDENGNALEFNKTNVTQLLTDLPDLFKDIQEQANKLALFRVEALDEEAKN